MTGVQTCALPIFCRDGGSVLDAFFGESLKHAPGYHVIDGAVLFGEEQRLLARDEQGMVVCHLAAVQAAACRHGFRLQLALPFGQAADEGKQLGDFREHVFGNVAASGSRIGDELLLVELLRDFKRLSAVKPCLALASFWSVVRSYRSGVSSVFSLRSAFVTVAVPADFTLLYSSVADSFSFHFSEEENFTVPSSQPSVAIWSCQKASGVKRRFSQ